MKKVKVHLEKAERNAQKAKKKLEEGNEIKGNHFQRISEKHYRDAMYYLKFTDEISLAMAI